MLLEVSLQRFFALNRFDPKPSHVRLVVDIVVTGHVSLRILRSSTVTPKFHSHFNSYTTLFV